jgi:hypothetical protein
MQAPYPEIIPRAAIGDSGPRVQRAPEAFAVTLWLRITGYVQ